MQLKTEETYKFGQKNIIPHAGEVSISAEGFITVEDEATALAIEASNIGFTIVKAEGIVVTPKPLEEDLNKKAEENEFGSGSDDEKDSIGATDEEKAALRAELENASMVELTALAKPFPKKEWSKLAQPELITYLQGKLA